MSKKLKLPQGWRIDADYCYEPGTGYGDDLYCPALYHWEFVTVGHLWWKKTCLRWVLVNTARYMSEAKAIKYLTEYAQAMDILLREASK